MSRVAAIAIAVACLAFVAACTEETKTTTPATPDTAKAAAATDVAAAPVGNPQTTCPAMGGKIDTSLYVDHDGKRIYVCCAACIDAIKKDPAKYIKKLEDAGVTLAKAPAEPEK